VSLINKMLSDLEQRAQDLQRNTKPEPVLDGLRAANEDSHRIPKQRRAWWLLVALAAVSFLAWQWYPIVQQRWQALRSAAKTEIKHVAAAAKEPAPTEHAKRENVAVIDIPIAESKNPSQSNHDSVAPQNHASMVKSLEKTATQSIKEAARQADTEEFFALTEELPIIVESASRKKENTAPAMPSHLEKKVVEPKVIEREVVEKKNIEARTVEKKTIEQKVQAQPTEPLPNKTEAIVKPKVMAHIEPPAPIASRISVEPSVPKHIDDPLPNKMPPSVIAPIAAPTAPSPRLESRAIESRIAMPAAIGAPDEIDVAVLAPPAMKAIAPPSKPRLPEAPPVTHVTKTLETLTSEQQALQSFNDGMSFWQQGKLRDAEAALRRSLAGDQRQTSARAALTRMLMEQNRWADAQVVAEEGLQRVPNDKETRQLLARLLLERKDALRAVELLETGAKQGGVTADYYGLMAESYRQIGRAADAASAYRSAINQNPQEGRWWIGLAVALETDGKPKDALQAYERALQTDVLPETLNRFANQRISVLRNAP